MTERSETTVFPLPIEAGNGGDGSPLTLGDRELSGAAFLKGGSVTLVDWDGDGQLELIDSTSALFAYHFTGAMADGTPSVDRGLRLGVMSRSHQRDENDAGLCGPIRAAGDFDGDGQTEIILGPRGYSKLPTVVLSLGAGSPPSQRSEGVPLRMVGESPAESPDENSAENSDDSDEKAAARWERAQLTAFDWDGDGRVDLIAAVRDGEGYYWIDPATGETPEDQRRRYHRDGVWTGRIGDWSIHLFRNTGSPGRPEFTYAGPVPLPQPPPGGPLAPVDVGDPTAGLLILGYYGEVFHLPLLEPGENPRWGEVAELFSAHGAPFSRSANFLNIQTASLKNRDSGPGDLFAGDVSSNVCWCAFHGRDSDGRPVYADPRKITQSDPHVNGGYFSVPTVGDWRGTGVADLLVGSIEGYVFWYKTLSTAPLRFAPPERVRVGDEEIRCYAKPDPAGGVHWGGSQGPLDGSNGGYSNPVLVDWSGDGRLDLLVGDMVGLFRWYPNRGTKTTPRLDPPFRLFVGEEPLFGPWRVQPGVGDFSGDGLPDIVTMDLDLDLALYRRSGREDLSDLQPGEKLRYEDGASIKTHGVYTPQGGDGRGRTKIQVVDWDGDGRLDLLLGVGPQGGSAFKSSYVLLCRNVGTNQDPLFSRPRPLLFNTEGQPLEFWRHGAHPTAVDWDGDGEWELVVGADMGYIWYFKPEHFGQSSGPFDLFRPEGDQTL